MSWIKIEEREPSQNTVVITYGDPLHDGIGISICTYTDDIFRFLDSERENKSNITHWHELPDSPDSPEFPIYGDFRLLTGKSNNADYPEDNYKTERKTIASGGFVVYQTFLKEAVAELLKSERSIVKDGYVKITIDEAYRCSDDDLAKYKIEYKYPLHLIHLGVDLHIAQLKISDNLKMKWRIS